MSGGMMGRLGVALVMAGALFAGAASATPTCSTIDNLGPSGQGVFLKSQFTSGFCVLAQDKLFGDFNLGNLPSSLVVLFNLNTIGNMDYHQISFDATYSKGTTSAGRTYNWSYEVAVAPNAVLGTKIVELDADFSQTAGGPSVLTKTTNIAGAGTIQETKTGANSSGTTSILFSGGITDMIVTEKLVDKGTISAVTNTIVEQIPAPEPASLMLLGGALAGLGALRRKRKN